MQCPRCDGMSLTLSERQNVEIDYCEKCRGIWLDRGELDKLIERAEQAESSEYASGSRARAASQSSRPDFSDSDHYSDRKRYGGRKKSWLGEIFD
jgi:uncharacterized protein